MTNRRAASLSVLLVLSLAGGAARAGGPRQYVRDYRAFKAKHGLKPLAIADQKLKIKPHKAFRQTRKTGVEPENLAPAPRMEARMKQLGDRVRGIKNALDGVAGRAERTDLYAVGESARWAMTQYHFAVGELREAVAFHGTHKVGSEIQLRAAAVKLRDAMAPQMAIIQGGKDRLPQRPGADMLTGSLAGASARDAYNLDRTNAVRADRILKDYIATGQFEAE